MSIETTVDLKARFDHLLAGCDAYYRDLERRLAAENAQPSPDAGRRRALEAALARATELIDILESATHDRLSRLSPP